MKINKNILEQTPHSKKSNIMESTRCNKNECIIVHTLSLFLIYFIFPQESSFFHLFYFIFISFHLLSPLDFDSRYMTINKIMLKLKKKEEGKGIRTKNKLDLCEWLRLLNPILYTIVLFFFLFTIK